MRDDKKVSTRKLDAMLAGMAPKKTVVVAIQLRVPTKMRSDEVKAYVASAIASERGKYAPEDNAFYVSLYRDRVETFMP